MIKLLLKKIFGSRNDRLIKNYLKIVTKINLLEESLNKLDDDALKAKTNEFKLRLKNNETLDDILIEAFATCREASKRVLNMRHFDVQLIGGIALHQGKIAEMRTGEGKTLASTLAVYLNALNGSSVHVITVNDYLVKRDAHEMSKLYNFLGLSVGVNLPDIGIEEKIAAYQSDVVYGTNNEFGFDYLRDNMVFNIKDKTQRDLNFAIIDEVDSVLIDEARTPLIISGMIENNNELCVRFNNIPPKLVMQTDENDVNGDFWCDEKNHNIVLSENGHIKIEGILQEYNLLKGGDSLYSPQNISLMHYLMAALKAHYIYKKDQHYVVKDNQVIIVDEFTGRLMSGRRWSDGLHQAVEAKEYVAIEQENQTLASITFQNFFKLYNKLSGMTGTADTEAYEFNQIYNLETVVIPTNQLMIRIDYNDQIYMNAKDKYQAIIEAIKKCHQSGQPILIGTTSVEISELISSLLTKEKLQHQVLNAKQHDNEANIIANGGSLNAITVATNMAGRGTDIVLGGNIKPQIEIIKNDNKLSKEQKENLIIDITNKWQQNNKKVLELGGLAIIGTERHESRRIDNQLRGRAGRQGDCGSSKFYLSLDDSLLRIFGGERMRSMMHKFGMKDGESIEHKWLSRSIESAQRKVEGHNFDTRKQLLDYDNVFNQQRSVIYAKRNEILNNNNLDETIDDIMKVSLYSLCSKFIMLDNESNDYVQNDIDALNLIINNQFMIDCDIKQTIKALDENSMGQKNNTNIANINTTIEHIVTFILNEYHNKFNNINPEDKTNLQRYVLLQQIDQYWREHLTHLEQLRQGIHLRGYAQKDPKREFQTESFNLFALMLDNIKTAITETLLQIQLKNINYEDQINNEHMHKLNFIHNDINEQDHSDKSHNTHKHNFIKKEIPNIPRNALCSCGSKKKYKHCHGVLK